MNKFEELKDKYAEGYRCIYKENDSQEGTTVHLKNFYTEKICTISTKSDMEIGEMENFLLQLEKIKREAGHDCHNT